MFVVLVEFEIKAGHEQGFKHQVLEQAVDSLSKETACQVFDVCSYPGRPASFLLYEVYDDEASFQVHLDSDHFKSFDAEVSGWVLSKAVSLLSRLN